MNGNYCANIGFNQAEWFDTLDASLDYLFTEIKDPKIKKIDDPFNEIELSYSITEVERYLSEYGRCMLESKFNGVVGDIFTKEHVEKKIASIDVTDLGRLHHVCYCFNVVLK